jgi:DNA modification methylase
MFDFEVKTTKMSYEDFLRKKMAIAPVTGFDIAGNDLTPTLLPHIKDSVKWMIHGGCRALFSSFGLQKTATQLEVMRIITTKFQKKSIIVCPLNVVDEFYNDAAIRFDKTLNIEYIKSQSDAEKCDKNILITNYERVRDGNINPDYFISATLDEASVLRSYGSKTYQEFLPKFSNVKYKYVATATPSPNRYKELIHYAGYLGIMDTGNCLTRFFHRDSQHANNLTLYPGKEQEFWFWLSTWALFITKPSDINPKYSDEGFVLPELEVRYHKVDCNYQEQIFNKFGEQEMFHDSAMGLKEASREKRETIPQRIAEMKKIVDESPDDHFILWHDLEAERYAIKKVLPEASEVFGSQETEKNSEITKLFKDGKIKYLATKPDLSAQGGNLQYYCHRAIYVGIGYKFNDFIQSIMRIQRFGQNYPVIIDIIYAESEQSVLDTLLKKWKQHKKLVETMVNIIKKYGLSSTNIQEKLERIMITDIKVCQGKKYRAILADNCVAIRKFKDNCVDLTITSIPFSNHYEYTSTYNDFGYNEDNAKFFEQLDYLTPELLRVTKPGRLCCVHVKDRILFGNATGTGMPTLDPFHCMTIAHFMKHGFLLIGIITIETDVVRENNQTYRLGWTENCKDGTKMGVGCPEYVLIFRKSPTDTSRAYADNPVTHGKKDYTRAQWQIDASSLWRSSGNRLISLPEFINTPVSSLQQAYRKFSRETVYDYESHVELSKDLDSDGRLPASFSVMSVGSWNPDIWDDVNRMITLNSEQSRKELQLHICPLQLDVVNRLIERYSNPGEIVFDPFAGLFTVPYCAVKKGRRGLGIELNEQSFHDGLAYLKAADIQASAPTLFDMLDAENKKAVDQ